MGVPQHSLVHYWKSEGRVHLDYGCPVWHSGLTVSQSHSLDRAQRVAMAAITGRWEQSHTSQLDDLGLERLSARRVRLCERFARRTAEKSRHQDMFQPVPNPRPVRQAVKRPVYMEKWARTAAYRRSPLPYLTRLLNSA